MSRAHEGGRYAAAPCNARLLKKAREQRGMTQADLAAFAGFSERLIVKAEAGRSVSRQTLEVLAQALSEGQRTAISPADLTSDPLALARRYTEALYTCRDAASFVGNIKEFLAEDVVFVISGDPAVIPFAGEWRGIAEVERGFEIFFSILEAPVEHDFDAHYRYLADGADVVVWGDSFLHPKGQALSQPMSVSNLLRFKDGRLFRFEDNYDTQWAESVLGKPGD